jgi:hypothetical protein
MATGVIPALWNSSKITLRVLWRAARQFFHEAMGALFAIFALYGAVAAWRQWHSKVAAWLLGFCAGLRGLDGVLRRHLVPTSPASSLNFQCLKTPRNALL